MSDVKVRANETAATPAAASAQSARQEALAGSDQGSFGRALAAAREARGLSRSDVAAQLRLNLRQVEAIEAEDLAALPEAPFVRGYLRNYAKLVDLPAEPLLSLLNARLKPADPLHSSFVSKPVSPIQSTPREPISGGLVIGGVVLLLAALAALGWWTMRRDAAPAAPPAAVAPPPPAMAPAAEPAAAEAAAEPPPAEAPPIAASALKLTFNDRSWVEIRQADGTVLLSQNNAAGTTRVVEGKPPYLLVIGNASKVALEYGGQQIDLAPSISRDDVARLRLE